MADKEQLALLEQGPPAWNEWRALNPDARVDLSNADLSGAKLSRANLSGADLSNADLSGAKLSNADLSNADLSGANLSGVKLSNADLSGAKLSGAKLSRADLSGAKLSRANLSGADLSNADLSGAKLSNADLSNANLSGANLAVADLSGADLSGANLAVADLSGADLSDAKLSGANLSGADLFSADLSGAKLSGANLSRADLSTADLSEADLSYATLHGANLTRANVSAANLTDAVLYYTVLGSMVLSKALGLEAVVHHGPSVIDHLTLLQSGRLPLSFLRGCGLPDRLIDYLPSLLNAAPIQFYSCFISYSTANQDFAERLHADLQARGVRCWFAPHSIRAGKKLHEQIDEAIRIYDRLLLILSPESMASEWVATEIAKARKKEAAQNRRVLFPLSIVPYSSLKEWVLFDDDRGKDSAREIREYFIPDFSTWKDHDVYTRAFESLLKALKSEDLTY